MSLSTRWSLWTLVVALGAGAVTAQASGQEPPPAADRFASVSAYAHYLRARLAVERGDLPAAAEELCGALIFDDASPQLRLALAEVLSRMAQLAPAESDARRALEGDPRGPTGARALALLGRIHAAQRQRDLAVEELQRAIQMEIALAAEPPEGGEARAEVDPGPWQALAGLYLEAGDEDGAARTYQDLAARLPGASGGLREMGRAYLERRDPARAEKYLRQALDRDPRDVEAWRLLAALEETEACPAESLRAYQALLAIDGEDLEALFTAGKLSLGAGDVAGASAYFGQLLRLAPEEGSARVDVALAWAGARRFSEALAVVEEGLRSGPGAVQAQLLLARGAVFQDQRRWIEAARTYGAVGPESGELWLSALRSQAYCLERAGRHGQALRALEQPLAARPRDTRLLTLKAFILERAGRAGDAVNLLEKALQDREASPEEREGTSELYEALASSLGKSGRHAEAVARLQRATRERPRDPVLGYALGTAYERAGAHESALAQMRALLVVEPDHAEALNFLGYSYADGGVRLEEAERLIGRALQLRPNNASFLDSLGWLRYRQGNLAAAVAALQEADALSGPEPTILEHLGDALRALQRTADAAAAYRRALQSLNGGEEPERPGQRQDIQRQLRRLRQLGSGALPPRWP